MDVNSKIDSNYDNNDNYDVSINIPEVKLRPERGLCNGLSSEETLIIEPEMTKVIIAESAASRKSRRQDEKGKDSDSGNSEHETEKNFDELDGPDKKMRLVEEEMSLPEEIEIEEAESKKVNSFAAKKTVAQGMMDIALITANANQLRYIIEFNSKSSTFYLIVILISFSLVLQVGVGMALIFKGRLDIKGRSKDPDAKRINNYVVVAIFLVTIINVFIASFTVTGNNNNV
ncbi:ninjurin-2-like [Anoplophora glabripennis]|uniref:ninjurin-2-like n=1 Tax=Anoplophora glabripennis TaxID=217634 RepID=UPI000874D19C|nr:ninjurin-2-like [Anoplophora glabripennis]